MSPVCRRYMPQWEMSHPSEAQKREIPIKETRPKMCDVAQAYRRRYIWKGWVGSLQSMARMGRAILKAKHWHKFSTCDLIK